MAWAEEMTPNPVGKRLEYVARQYRDYPNAIYWAIAAALELKGIHRIKPPSPPSPRASERNAEWHQLLVDFIRKHSRELGRHPYEKHLPWVAREVSRARGEMGFDRVGYDLMMRLRSIGDWATAEHIDLGRWSADEAIDSAREWAEEHDPVDVVQGTVVYRFPDGWTVQELEAVAELEDEGEAMQHCVGDYCDDVDEGIVRIYSIRDPSGKPHVTLEFDTDLGQFTQIRGKQNVPPVERYWPYVGAFVRHANADYRMPESYLQFARAVIKRAKQIKADEEAIPKMVAEAVSLALAGEYEEALEVAERARMRELGYFTHDRLQPLVDAIEEAVKEWHTLRDGEIDALRRDGIVVDPNISVGDFLRIEDQIAEVGGYPLGGSASSPDSFNLIRKADRRWARTIRDIADEYEPSELGDILSFEDPDTGAVTEVDVESGHALDDPEEIVLELAERDSLPGPVPEATAHYVEAAKAVGWA